MFAYFEKIGFQDVAHSYYRQVNKGHGRLEIRQCWLFSPHPYSQYFRTLASWPAWQTVVLVRSERHIGSKVETAQRFFISSRAEDAQSHLGYIRAHWGIENKLHWVLDVAFREDDHRARQGDSAANFAVIRHLVRNLLRQETAFKAGLHAPRLRCAWDVNYRLRVLERLFSAN